MGKPHKKDMRVRVVSGKVGKGYDQCITYIYIFIDVYMCVYIYIHILC